MEKTLRVKFPRISLRGNWNPYTIVASRSTHREKGQEDEAESICRSNVTAVSSCSYLLQVINKQSHIPLYFIKLGFLFFFLVIDLDMVSPISRVNGINFEEIEVSLAKRQQLSPEFKGVAIISLSSKRKWIEKNCWFMSNPTFRRACNVNLSSDIHLRMIQISGNIII